MIYLGCIFNLSKIDWSAVAAIASVLYTVIALIGMIYIIRSFKQQSTINNALLQINTRQLELSEQQKSLNSLALKGHIRNVRPIFVYSEEKKEDRIDFKLKNAIGRKINIWILDKDENILEHFVKNTTGMPNEYSFFVYKSGANPRFNSKKIFLLIKYLDEDGRFYYQKVYNNIDFGITWPKLLPEDKTIQEIIADPNR